MRCCCKSSILLRKNSYFDGSERLMATIITIASQKGGVGKTTTALNLGYSLSQKGKKVLVVDGDPQGGFSEACNLKKKTAKGLLHILSGKVKVRLWLLALC